jgi:hypothetical protein
MSLGAPASLPAFAQGISVEGVVDCGSWIKARSSKVCIGKACTGVGGGQVMLLENYLQGTLNGMALGAGIEFWQAGGIRVSPEQAFL